MTKSLLIHEYRFLNSNNDFIGFWSMCPLFNEIYEKAKKGKFTEELSVEMIPDMIPGEYNIFITSICLKKEYLNTFAIQKLIYSLIDAIEEYALSGIFVNEICAWAYTKDGMSLCKSMGLRYITDHTWNGKIFCEKVSNIIDTKVFRNFKILKELYSK